VDVGHDRCARCLFQQRVCLCAAIPVIETRTRIVIVRHSRERNRSSNTGRLAHLALPNSVIVDHGDPGGAPTVLPSLEGAWVVYPSGEPLERAPEPPPAQLVILDATWSQARRMFHKLGALRGLPILRFPDAPMPAGRLRASPAEGHVSTIEAIARALRLVEGDHVATPLETVFQVAVSRAEMTGRKLVS
jgi:DTW domain-containing protein